MSQPKLLNQVREHSRLTHRTLGTEQAYLSWTRRYVQYHPMRHPADLGAEHVQQFLSYPALEEDVAASTQNHGFAALLILYRPTRSQVVQSAKIF